MPMTTACLTSSWSAWAAAWSSALLPKRVASIGSPNQKYRRSGRGIGVPPTPTATGRVGKPMNFSYRQANSPYTGVSWSMITSSMSSAPTDATGMTGMTVLDRQLGEADALPPLQLVLLAAVLVDLARAAGVDQDRLPVVHQARTLSRVPRTIAPAVRNSRQTGSA